MCDNNTAPDADDLYDHVDDIDDTVDSARLAWIKSNDTKLDRAQVQKIIDERVREDVLALIECKSTYLTRDDIMVLIRCQDPLIRSAIAECDTFTPDAEMVDAALSLRDRLSESWMSRYDWTPTEEQIESGLGYPHCGIRLLWVVRKDYELSYQQIERALADPVWQVRCACANRDMDIPREILISRLLEESDNYVLEALGKHAVSTRIPVDVIDELLDKRISKVDLFIARNRLWTPESRHVMYGMSSSSVEVRLAWAERMDFTPSFEQVVEGITDKDSEQVKLAWIRRTDYKMTYWMTEKILLERNRLSTAELLLRSDWTPTEEQITRGLSIRSESDDGTQIAVLWSRRLSRDMDAGLDDASETHNMTV